jgi:tRNA(Ile)-lysidine synthase
MTEMFGKFIDENSLFRPEEKILLAVSGGIDSMVMAHLFLRGGFDFSIAHCNFSLRGSESDGDEEFVTDYGAVHQIKVYTKRFDTTGFAVSRGLSIQMAARELRYKWFEELRAGGGFSAVALAHNLNDNIETFLINLVRGTGIAGLAGIKPKNETLIRPLLFASRNTIKEYSEKYEVRYREDSSNADTKYTRNKIRHLIVPILREINPSFENTIEETIARVTDINEIYSGHISRIKSSILREEKDCVKAKISEITALTPLNTMLFELFRGYGITKPMIPELIKLTTSRSGGQLNTSSHRFIRNRGEIIIDKFEQEPEPETIQVFKDLDALISGCLKGKAKVVSCKDDFQIPREMTATCLSLNKLKFPVTIRKWKRGDIFYPLGMNRKKKLSDFFIDNKFSIPEKERAMVLESDDKIACIIGIRTDNRFRITRSTTKCLIIDTSPAVELTELS